MGMTNATAPAPTETTAESLKIWRDRMGYSKVEAATELGCSRNAWARWEAGTMPVPRYIGLACAALAMGMPAYGSAK